MAIDMTEPLHPVLQGEGPNAGEKMILLRTHGCPVKCPDCDSQHTWTKGAMKMPTPVDDIAFLIRQKGRKYHTKQLLVTGGEPALWHKELIELFTMIPEFTIEYETSGILPVTELRDFYRKIHFNISPKVTALVANTKRWKIFETFLPLSYSMKFVVSKDTWEKDIETIIDYQHKYDIPNKKIWLMPMGINRKEIIKQSKFVIEKCFELDYHFSPRLHILIYDDKKLV